MKIFKRRFEKGFTIIELLVVVAIIGILAGVVIIALDSSKVKAHDAQRTTELKELQQALEAFYSQNAGYPQCNTPGGWCGSDNGEFQTALQPLVDAELIPEIVSDPLNYEGYIYEYYTQAGTSIDTCGGTDVNQFKYVIRFATEARELTWPEAEGFTTEGNAYCFVSQSR